MSDLFHRNLVVQNDNYIRSMLKMTNPERVEDLEISLIRKDRSNPWLKRSMSLARNWFYEVGIRVRDRVKVSPRQAVLKSQSSHR